MSEGNQDTILEEYNADGNTVERYYCEKLTANNQLQDLIVPYYYDLAYPCEDPPEEGRELVAAALLSRARSAYLASVEVCVRPQNPWFAAVSSRPEDAFANFRCQQLNHTCCIVVEGSMTFTELSEANADDIKRWVAASLDDPTLAAPFKLSYLGSELDPNSIPDDVVSNTTRPPNSPVAGINQDEPRTAPPPEDKEFTIVGIFILIGLCMVFLTSLFLLWKRRRRYIFERKVDAALAESELGLDKGVSEVDGGIIDVAPTWEDRTFDDVDDSRKNNTEVHTKKGNLQIRSVSSISYRTTEGYQDDGMHNSLAREPHLNTTSSSPRRYRFDLTETPSSSLPTNRPPVAGSYYGPPDLFGPNEITVVPPYPISDDNAANQSESEADSWAQTDGELGSLEDGEPGRILAELEQGVEVGEI